MMLSNRTSIELLVCLLNFFSLSQTINGISQYINVYFKNFLICAEHKISGAKKANDHLTLRGGFLKMPSVEKTTFLGSIHYTCINRICNKIIESKLLSYIPSIYAIIERDIFPLANRINILIACF